MVSVVPAVHSPLWHSVLFLVHLPAALLKGCSASVGGPAPSASVPTEQSKNEKILINDTINIIYMSTFSKLTSLSSSAASSCAGNLSELPEFPKAVVMGTCFSSLNGVVST